MILEKTLESLLDSKEIIPVNLKGNQSWILFRRRDAEAEAAILWPPIWTADSLEKTLCWQRLKAGGEEGKRGWDVWMASLIQWVWTWANSGRWWGTGKLGVLQPMGVTKGRAWFGDWTITTGEELRGSEWMLTSSTGFFGFLPFYASVCVLVT